MKSQTVTYCTISAILLSSQLSLTEMAQQDHFIVLSFFLRVLCPGNELVQKRATHLNKWLTQLPYVKRSVLCPLVSIIIIFNIYIVFRCSQWHPCKAGYKLWDHCSQVIQYTGQENELWSMGVHMLMLSQLCQECNRWPQASHFLLAPIYNMGAIKEVYLQDCSKECKEIMGLDQARHNNNKNSCPYFLYNIIQSGTRVLYRIGTSCRDTEIVFTAFPPYHSSK